MSDTAPTAADFTALADRVARLEQFVGIPSPVAPVAFVGTDDKTQGTWRGVYGGDGCALAQSPSSMPAAAGVGFTDAIQYVWAATTSDPRGVQKAAPAFDRLAACWYHAASFDANVSVGPTPTRVALYLLDWDRNNRSQRVDAINPDTGAVFDTRTVSGFEAGRWLVYTVTGKVRFRFTHLTGPNAVLSAICFGGVSDPVPLPPPPVPPPPPPPTDPTRFNIFVQPAGMSASQQAIFQQAAARWGQIIVGDLPDAMYNGVPVDDLLIDATAPTIDGQGGILGNANPDRFRNGSFLPYHGSMRFDSADLDWLESVGQLQNVILHEMGHVLGVGVLWSTKGFLAGATGQPTDDPIFTGPLATAEYNAIFGTSAAGAPAENQGGSGTAYVHWRESVMGGELMTGWLSGKCALSRVTAASLADLGYQVNMAAADPYTPTDNLRGAVEVEGVMLGCGAFLELPPEHLMSAPAKWKRAKRIRRKRNGE